MPGIDTPTPLDIPNPDGPFPEPFPFPGFELPRKWDRPVWDHIRWGPATLRILVVSDGSSYDTSPFGFSLGFALADMSNIAHPDHPSYARFAFTKAHRTTDTGVTAGFENFRFNPGSLDGFDEVWLFGYTPGAPYLSPQEVQVIEAFMDAGGGVLAMGDHEDLGLGLCGGIKRVRSMRKWWFDSPAPPAGMLRAPDSTDLTRNDTQQPPLPGSQSDAIAQPIYPNYRYAWPYWRPWWRRQKYPHPILCGPRGAITVFPDHAHEGDCILPDPAFAGEFPGGVAVEVIARGRNVVGREKGGFVISDPRAFGLLGVWDGHAASGGTPGRVVVDATWHHWFNVNLTGLRTAGGDTYADILAVFRNIAIWLAPKGKQAAMRRAGTRILLLTPSLVEHVAVLRDWRPATWYWLGIEARDALGRIAPQCQSAAWFDWVVSPALDVAFRKFALNDRYEGAHTLVESAVIEAASATAFGAAINALAIEVNKRGFEAIGELDEEIDKIAIAGARRGLAEAAEQLSRSSGIFEALGKARSAKAD